MNEYIEDYDEIMDYWRDYSRNLYDEVILQKRKYKYLIYLSNYDNLNLNNHALQDAVLKYYTDEITCMSDFKKLQEIFDNVYIIKL